MKDRQQVMTSELVPAEFDDEDDVPREKFIREFSSRYIKMDDPDDILVDFECDIHNLQRGQLLVTIEGQSNWLPRYKVMVTRCNGVYTIFMPESLAKKIGLL